MPENIQAEKVGRWADRHQATKRETWILLSIGALLHLQPQFIHPGKSLSDAGSTAIIAEVGGRWGSMQVSESSERPLRCEVLQRGYNMIVRPTDSNH